MSSVDDLVASHVGLAAGQRRDRPRVLMIDDDESLVEILHDVLEDQGFDVLAAADGTEATDIVASERPDLVILDLTLPGRDGVEVLAGIRQFSHVPVIILSGRHQTEVKVTCLGLGADDYVTKPFDSAEFLARVRAVLRRSGTVGQPAWLSIGDIQIDLESREVTVAGELVSLTKYEFEVLRELALSPGNVLGYDYLWRKVWGYDLDVGADSIRHVVSRLRSKVEADPSNPQHIITVAGIGLKLRLE